MKIAILNNASISAATLNRWFPDTEVKIIKKKELIQLKRAKADILLIEDNLTITKNGDNPYVLAITPQPPQNAIDWVSSEATVETIQNKIKNLLDYLTLKHKYEQAKRQLCELGDLAVLGRIFRGILHELSNPLQVMLGFIEDIEEQLADEGDFGQDIRMIKEEIVRCCDILAKVKFLRNVGNEEDHQDIEIVLLNILPLLEHYRREKKIEFVIKIKDDVKFVKGESNRIHTIIIASLIIAIENCQENSKIHFTVNNSENGVKAKIKFKSTTNQTIFWPVLILETYLSEIGGTLTYIPEGSNHTYIVDFKQVI